MESQDLLVYKEFQGNRDLVDLKDQRDTEDSSGCRDFQDPLVLLEKEDCQELMERMANLVLREPEVLQVWMVLLA